MKLNFRKIFESNTNLFISGETGVGKSCLVRQLALKYRPGNRCVVVNMASLGDGLFESQMFGHKRGAFTGAHQDHVGYLETAQGGVLFLDEVAELSLSAQKKLLEILEERTFTPVGSTQAKVFNGLIVLASHKNLAEMVSEGSFREDLYFRIHRLHFKIDPLRLRREEIKMYLTPKRHFFCDNVWSYLTHEYPWRGNFREMKNFVESLEFFEREKYDSIEQLPLMKAQTKTMNNDDDHKFESYHEAIGKFEKDFFEGALKRVNGRVNYAAKELGISKTTLIAKLKKYGISSHMIKALSQAA